MSEKFGYFGNFVEDFIYKEYLIKIFELGISGSEVCSYVIFDKNDTLIHHDQTRILKKFIADLRTLAKKRVDKIIESTWLF